MRSDRELMIEAAEGDADAIAELAQRHRAWLRRFLYHLL